jgi:hypothetical protein
MMLQDDDHPAHKAIALVLTMGLISYTLEEIGTYEKTGEKFRLAANGGSDFSQPKRKCSLVRHQ